MKKKYIIITTVYRYNYDKNIKNIHFIIHV